MARALLLALTCAAAASAVTYNDYSGIKMPQYGNGAEYDVEHDSPPSHPSDDYHGHSPDAPASPDYKYEEEPRPKTEKSTREPSDSDVWRKPGRKQRELVRPMESESYVRNKYIHSDDQIPKFRTNRRYSKHRSRLKNEIDERLEETPLPRRYNKYSRDRKDVVSDIDRKDYFQVDKDYIPDDKNKPFEDNVKFSRREETTKKANRRRPRDKQYKRQREESVVNDIDDEESEAENQMKGELEKEPSKLREGIRRVRPLEQRKLPGHLRYRPTAADEDESVDDPLKVIPGKFKLKGYNDYDDYYDMKRVNNIKNKLPSLLRRTTVSAVKKMNTNLLDNLFPNRRMLEPDTTPDPPTSESTSTTVSTTTTTTTTSAPISTDTTLNLLKAAHELSIAEKSRLSILKKAQRKEGQSFRSTKKPPVLLQVTSQMPTVVMVEPPSSTVPWMRAKEFEDDTPAKLEIVKRLMRQKLVKEAKSIHDLTDNWDEMVCDYIDTSLLENAATSPVPSAMYFIILCLQF